MPRVVMFVLLWTSGLFSQLGAYDSRGSGAGSLFRCARMCGDRWDRSCTSGCARICSEAAYGSCPPREESHAMVSAAMYQRRRQPSVGGASPTTKRVGTFSRGPSAPRVLALAALAHPRCGAQPCPAGRCSAVAQGWQPRRGCSRTSWQSSLAAVLASSAAAGRSSSRAGAAGGRAAAGLNPTDLPPARRGAGRHTKLYYPKVL
eukprot:SAG31_NODE_2598_length_5417_cov_16.893005_4_plen_204_part_00